MIKIPITQINKDKIKSTFVGVVKYSVLEKIVTLTVREESGGGKNNFFQRRTDEQRGKEIVKFIERELTNNNKKRDIPLALFPTAMILSFDPDNDAKNSIKINSGEKSFEIPDECDTEVLIVDGQHRFIGTQKFYKEHPDFLEKTDIEFLVTFLVGYDLFEQAKIFANVNFKQRPVKKDLYYDIFGSLPGIKNEMTLAHYTVKHLNEDVDSSLRDMIRMLGVGNGIISQAYLFKEIMALFSPNKIFGVYFSRYKEGKDDHKKILIFLKMYFKIIKKEFNNYWPKKNVDEIYKQREYKNVLLKTTGLGALIKLFDYILTDSLHLSSKEIEVKIEAQLKKISSEEAKKFFSEEGEYGKSGGLQNKLFNEIKNLLEYKVVADREVNDNKTNQ